MKNALNLRRLVRAVTLASHGSYVRAAEELNLSPSALSRSIHELELEIGTTLFFRDRSGVRPTPRGIDILALAEELLEISHRFEQSIKKGVQRNLEQVTFGFGPMPASVLLAPVVAGILNRHLPVKLQILGGTSKYMLDQLNAGAIEFFLCAKDTIGRSPHIMVTEMGTLPMCIRARAGHPLAAARDLSWNSVAAYPVIGARFEGGGKFVRLDQEGYYDPEVTVANYHIIADVLRRSDAVSIFLDDFPSEGLVTLDLAPNTIPALLHITAVSMRGQRLSTAAEQVIEEIQKQLASLAVARAR